MDTRQALLVDAFAAEPMAGTPVGVIPNADGLSGDQMQAVASEIGACATAFVRPDGEADRRLRCFRPESETDRWGTAAVAAHATLFERGTLDAGQWTVATAAGTYDGETKTDGTVWLERDSTEITERDLSYDAVADALGLDPATLRDVGADLPLVTADAGCPWLLVPVNYFEHLSALDPDPTAISYLCDRADARGMYPFTFDTLDGEATLHGRALTASGGTREEPVTGSAAGACGAFVRRYGAIDDTVEQVVVEQGHFRDRPGTVRVDTDGSDVWIGGHGVTTLDGTVTVPIPEDDDDIIEA